MNTPMSCPVSGLRKILLATDGSQFSAGAVREAISLAKRCSATLYAISAVEDMGDYDGRTIEIEEMREAEVKQLLIAVQESAANEGVACETIVAHGNADREIIEAAKIRQADVIVLGRRGRRGLTKVLMGSVAAGVIQHAPCNVLVVPKAAKIEHKTTLVAIDGSAHSQSAASMAIGLVKQCGGGLMALSAIPNEDERAVAQTQVNSVVEQGKSDGVAVEPLTSIGKAHEVIIETAGGRGVDLIVMAADEKTAMTNFFAGGTTEKVAERAGCAVLVVKAQS